MKEVQDNKVSIIDLNNYSSGAKIIIGLYSKFVETTQNNKLWCK